MNKLSYWLVILLVILAGNFSTLTNAEAKFKHPKILPGFKTDFLQLDDEDECRLQWEIESYGIYERIPVKCPDDGKENKDSSIYTNLIKRTLDIPAELDLLVGVRFKVYVTLNGKVITGASLPFKKIVTFPPRINPKTGKVEKNMNVW